MNIRCRVLSSSRGKAIRCHWSSIRPPCLPSSCVVYPHLVNVSNLLVSSCERNESEWLFQTKSLSRLQRTDPLLSRLSNDVNKTATLIYSPRRNVRQKQNRLKLVALWNMILIFPHRSYHDCGSSSRTIDCTRASWKLIESSSKAWRMVNFNLATEHK